MHLPIVPQNVMFHVVRNTPKSGTVEARSAAELVQARLPPGWAAELRANTAGGDWLTLRGSDGRRAKLLVVSRKRVSPKDVLHLVQQSAGQGLLFAAPFLSSRTREVLARENASYVDATGNLRVVVSEPAIFLEASGSDRDPERKPRELRSLKGAAAGRVVRALCDFAPPYGVRTLAEISKTPLGTVSRVVSLLEEEALLVRNEKKLVISVDWPVLIARWATDYSVTRSNILRSYLEPRGLSALIPKVAKLGRYAVTGSLVGPGIAPARLAMIYVDDAQATAKALDLVPTESGANVWLLEPYDPVVFDRMQELPLASGTQSIIVRAAAPSQVAADLMTSPGRAPQEADALLEKMKGTEDTWRTPA